MICQYHNGYVKCKRKAVAKPGRKALCSEHLQTNNIAKLSKLQIERAYDIKTADMLE